MLCILAMKYLTEIKKQTLATCNHIISQTQYESMERLQNTECKESHTNLSCCNQGSETLGRNNGRGTGLPNAENLVFDPIH